VGGSSGSLKKTVGAAAVNQLRKKKEKKQARARMRMRGEEGGGAHVREVTGQGQPWQVYTSCARSLHSHWVGHPTCGTVLYL
jgi:hypothetical protein